MNPPRRIRLDEWPARRSVLLAAGLREPWYGGPLHRHVDDGDLRLRSLRFDDGAAALALWNFLLTEEARLRAARARGWCIVGAMKDLGTVPLLAYALPKVLTFYPDGAWWAPCIMENTSGVLAEADRLGVDESFCPVRAMLGALATGRHFPRPDLLTCAVGATCDDLSAIAQRVERLGLSIAWWELPPARRPDPGEAAERTPAGTRVPQVAVAAVAGAFRRLGGRIAAVAGEALTEARLRASILAANRVRARVRRLRALNAQGVLAPLPALEMLVADMLAIHFCSDREECDLLLADLVEQSEARVAAGLGHGAADAVRVFWVNPVADLATLGRLEDLGGRLCGADFMVGHALLPIAEDGDPWQALALAALADPLACPGRERARRIAAAARRAGAEAVVVSRIPGASHCAWEGGPIVAALARLGLPTVEIEVPPLADACDGAIVNRLGAVLETARSRRRGP